MTLPDEFEGVSACQFYNVVVIDDVAYLEFRQAVLSCTEELTRPPEPQVFFRYLKSIVCFEHGRNPLTGFDTFGCTKEQAV